MRESKLARPANLETFVIKTIIGIIFSDYL
jgi:hypothetical protein